MPIFPAAFFVCCCWQVIASGHRKQNDIEFFPLKCVNGPHSEPLHNFAFTIGGFSEAFGNLESAAIRSPPDFLFGQRITNFFWVSSGRAIDITVHRKFRCAELHLRQIFR